MEGMGLQRGKKETGKQRKGIEGRRNKDFHKNRRTKTVNLRIFYPLLPTITYIKLTRHRPRLNHKPLARRIGPLPLALFY